MHILMVSAENGALPGAKVGGMGDVIGQVAPALADAGCRVTVVTPSHGFLQTLPGAVPVLHQEVMFRGSARRVELIEVPANPPHAGVRHLVVHHPHLGAFDPQTAAFRIYVHDPPDRPFATDASRFALFSAAVAAFMSRPELPAVDVVHLHDWHGALVLILMTYDPRYAALQPRRTVFSIHNLALQGIRPLRGNESSLEAWFPGLKYDWFSVADPHLPDCINLMAAGIRLADVTHTVSPTYAEEILQPSDKPQRYGAEGLEAVLQYAHQRGTLVGILNGCPYPDGYTPPKTTFKHMLALFKATLVRWAARHEALPASIFIAHARLTEMERRENPPDIQITSVGRTVVQKIQLMRATGSSGRSGLVSVLEELGNAGCMFMLGNGDEDYERFLTRLMAHHGNFVFLNGYSDPCARAIYANGDLFLMPSSYEPCGISQMLAMRDGQPCVVHAVGGLKDTVRHGVNGFAFSGQTLQEQVDNFVAATVAAVALKKTPTQWEAIRRGAASSRFPWSLAARNYLEKLYSAG